ncbi:MAG: hypothetical protein ACI835_002942 [Planctomycetota bacterium]|jgi:hypothetical protein
MEQGIRLCSLTLFKWDGVIVTPIRSWCYCATLHEHSLVESIACHCRRVPAVERGAPSQILEVIRAFLGFDEGGPSFQSP